MVVTIMPIHRWKFIEFELFSLVSRVRSERTERDERADGDEQSDMEYAKVQLGSKSKNQKVCDDLDARLSFDNLHSSCHSSNYQRFAAM